MSVSAAEGKFLGAGQLNNSAAVRHLLLESCPVGALADLAVHEFGSPGRLCEQNLLRGYIFHAPNCPFQTKMAESTVTEQVGKLLRAVGVHCDLTVLEGGKHCVTHALKKYSLAQVTSCLPSFEFVISYL